MRTSRPRPASGYLSAATKSILIVEDDALVREIVVTQITASGYVRWPPQCRRGAGRSSMVPTHATFCSPTDHAGAHEPPAASRARPETAPSTQVLYNGGLYRERHRASTAGSTPACCCCQAYIGSDSPACSNRACILKDEATITVRGRIGAHQGPRQARPMEAYRGLIRHLGDQDCGSRFRPTDLLQDLCERWFI